MASIPSLRGPVDTSKLGVTMLHEGLSFTSQPAYQKKTMDYQVRLLKKAAAVGMDTLALFTPWPDLPKFLEATAGFSQMNFLLSTGTFLRQCTPAAVRDLSEDDLIRRFVKELTKGYDGYESDGIRPALIRLGSNDGKLSDWEKKTFRAAARAQREVGGHVPIGLHSVAGAREQMRCLADSGANIPKTFYAHIEAEQGWEGRNPEQEADYLEEVLKAGGSLIFNNFDFEFDTPWRDMVYLINELDQRGYTRQILLTIDVNWEFDADGNIWHEQQQNHPETGRRDYAYMITRAVPMLMAEGVSLQRINRYLIENPRRILEP